MGIVTVFGLGYVGCVSSACLAELGHQVRGVDVDDRKVKSVLSGEAPFFEPGLGDLVRSNVQAGRLTATTSTAEGLGGADVALLCVGTPSESDGNLSLHQLRRVVADIAAAAVHHGKPLVIAVRSTVFPGTCEEIVMPAVSHLAHVSVVANPEFLREGSAVKDFMEPSLLVVGGRDAQAMRTVAGLYSSLNIEASLVELRTAEMIKYACNAFHAVKVSFANEIGSLSESLGVPGREVMATLCRDVKLNVSPAYLRPGFAFGGSCLPKDLRALNYRASRLDLQLPMLGSVLASNDAHLRRAARAVLGLPGAKLGIIGLSFKEDTDDLRESPVVSLLEFLIGKGRDLKVFDPHIDLTHIHGANQQYLLNAIPHIGRLLEPGIDAVLAWSDHLVVTQKPSSLLLDKIRTSRLPVLDLAGVLN
jgi:GDP-mannose 6-dehydrogenase